MRSGIQLIAVGLQLSLAGIFLAIAAESNPLILPLFGLGSITVFVGVTLLFPEENSS